jgi:hypothetical protein
MAPFPRAKVTVCALCGSAPPLCESHIIPRFVFEWLIGSSATGHIRLGTTPNLRVQDGLKQELLCPACEQRLSVWEASVAANVFRPYHGDTSRIIPYDVWMGRFAASIAWRVLFLFRAIGAVTNLSPKQLVLADQALDVWREQIFERASNPGPFELHLLPLDLLTGASGLDLPSNINRYLARAIEIDVVSTSKTAFVYAKMCK